MSNCSPAIAGTQEVVDPQAIGVVEFYSIASAIKAADAAAKSRSGDTDRSEGPAMLWVERLFHPYR